MNIQNLKKTVASVAALAAIMATFTACGETHTPPETTAAPTTTAAPIETTVPETTVPETTVPETTVPETTVPETTVPETTVPETTVPETTVPETTVPETTAPIDAPALSGNWADMQFTVDDVLFQLPTTVKELEAAGWIVELEEDADYELEPSTKLIHPFRISHPDYPGNSLNTITFYAYFWNVTEETLPLKDCEIYQVEMDAQYPMQKGNPYPSFVVGNGLKLGDSMETVEALCGEAYYTYESDLGYTTLEYRVDDEDNVWRSYHLEVTVYEDYGVAKIQLKIYN